MKKVMAMNGFQELKENELMETEGGIPPLIPILMIAGLALTLSGCSKDPDADTEPEPTPDPGDYYIHNQTKCHQSDSCNIGIGDCPYH